MPDIGLDLAQQHPAVIPADTLATFEASFSIVRRQVGRAR
jgi:hypothetical protein